MEELGEAANEEEGTLLADAQLVVCFGDRRQGLPLLLFLVLLLLWGREEVNLRPPSRSGSLAWLGTPADPAEGALAAAAAAVAAGAVDDAPNINEEADAAAGGASDDVDAGGCPAAPPPEFQVPPNVNMGAGASRGSSADEDGRLAAPPPGLGWSARGLLGAPPNGNPGADAGRAGGCPVASPPPAGFGAANENVGAGGAGGCLSTLPPIVEVGAPNENSDAGGAGGCPPAPPPAPAWLGALKENLEADASQTATPLAGVPREGALPGEGVMLMGLQASLSQSTEPGVVPPGGLPGVPVKLKERGVVVVALEGLPDNVNERRVTPLLAERGGVRLEEPGEGVACTPISSRFRTHQ